MIKIYKSLSILFIFSLLILSGCTEDPNPGLDVLIPPDGIPPVISSIEPLDGGLAGITVLTINGSNFSATPENNTVLFNGVKGELLEVSATQIKVKAPIVISDSVQVKIAVFKVEDFSNTYKYKLSPAFIEIYKFSPDNLEIPNAITIDAQENVYVSLSDKGIKKIDPQGVLTNWAPDGPAETFFNSLTFGPGNIIYATRRVRGVLQLVENTQAAVYISYAAGVGGVAVDTDFDQNLNMWIGGNGSILRVNPAKVIKGFTFNGNIKAIKIFNNSIFAAATSNNEEILWRIPIISADSLGTPEVYINFTQAIDPAIKINDIAIADDGDIYLGTDASIDPIYIVHPDKSYELLYPGVISSSVYSFVWGNGNDLYMTRNASSTLTQTVLKINVQKPGAPYYGRQ